MKKILSTIAVVALATTVMFAQEDLPTVDANENGVSISWGNKQETAATEASADKSADTERRYYVDDYKEATYDAGGDESFDKWTEKSILKIMEKLGMLTGVKTAQRPGLGYYYYAKGYNGIHLECDGEGYPSVGVDIDTPTEEVRKAALNELYGTFWFDAKNNCYWTFQSDYALEQAQDEKVREGRTICVLRDAKTKKVYKRFRAVDITNLYYSIRRENMPSTDDARRVNSKEADINDWLYRQKMYLTISFACTDTNRTYEFTVPVIEKEEKKSTEVVVEDTYVPESITDWCEACKRPLPKDATNCPYCTHDAEGINVYCPVCKYEFKVNKKVDPTGNSADMECPNSGKPGHEGRNGEVLEVKLVKYSEGLANNWNAPAQKAEKASIAAKLPKVLPVTRIKPKPVQPKEETPEEKAAREAAERKAKFEEEQRQAAIIAEQPEPHADDSWRTITLTVHNSKTKVKETYTLTNASRTVYEDDFYNGDGVTVNTVQVQPGA